MSLKSLDQPDKELHTRRTRMEMAALGPRHSAYKRLTPRSTWSMPWIA